MSIWIERYRPQVLENVILAPQTRKVLKNILESPNITSDFTNLLFTGSAGCGKTTCAKLIPKTLDLPYLYINASEENSVEVLRTRVKDFATSRTIDDKLKLVILDEADGLCLEENERILIGKIGEQKSIKITELKKNTVYDIVSLNISTKELENDVGFICTDRTDECFEVELEDGRIIKCTIEHPFFVLDSGGNIIEKPLNELKLGDEIIDIKL